MTESGSVNFVPEMNQQCKVCGEPAAGFHFGAFTCEGCKSFFGRSYNNLNSITECKNNGECIINKKNRTACKSCRLRKCLLVGMSKSGSRYGRRSNWFKIHCLLQEQQQAAVAQIKGKPPSGPLDNPLPLLSPLPFPHPNLGPFLRPNAASSPSVSSPDSDSSEPAIYSPRINPTNPFVSKDFYLPVTFHSMFMHPPSMSSPFLLPPSLLPFPVPPTKHNEFPQRLPSPDHVQIPRRPGPTPDLEDDPRPDSPPSRHSPTNNNDYSSKCNNKHASSDTDTNKCNNNCNNNDIVNNNNLNNNNNNNEDDKVTVRSKRFYLDAILGLKTMRSSVPEAEERRRSPKQDAFEEEQDNPIDLSLKSSSFKPDVTIQENGCQTDEPEEEEIKPKICGSHEELKPIPLDLSV